MILQSARLVFRMNVMSLNCLSTVKKGLNFTPLKGLVLLPSLINLRRSWVFLVPFT